MKDKLPVHIGPGATLDGGPYNQCEVTGVHEGSLYIEDASGETRLASGEEIQANVASEIRCHEPVNVSGVHPDKATTTVYLPLDDHMLVDIHGGGLYLVGDVTTSDRREDMLREATANGVDYGPNN